MTVVKLGGSSFWHHEFTSNHTECARNVHAPSAVIEVMRKSAHADEHLLAVCATITRVKGPHVVACT